MESDATFIAADELQSDRRCARRLVSGTVVAATADEPGPSRYFERLAVEASRNWEFTPTSTQEQRTSLLRFSFTGAGVAARAHLPE